MRLRQVLSTNEELARKVAQHDQKIDILFEHIKGLLELRTPLSRRLPAGVEATAKATHRAEVGGASCWNKKGGPI